MHPLGAMQDAVAATYRQRRHALWVSVCLLAAYAVLDLARSVPTYAVVARVAWIASMAGAALVQLPSRRRVADAAARLVGLVSGVCASLLVAGHGGSGGIYMGFLLGTSFCVLVLLPGVPSSAFLCGMATTFGGVALLLTEQRSGAVVLEWIALSILLNGLAAWGTLTYRRMMRREMDALREQRSLRARLDKAERLAALGTLAAGVAHEINNPLAYMKANLRWTRESLADDAPDRGEIAAALEETERGAERIARIVAELSVYARRSPEPTVFPVAPVLGEALRVVSARLEGVDVRLDVPSDVPPVSAVRDHLSQALVNLLANAVDAIDARCAMDAGAPRAVRVSAVRDGAAVVVSVEDSGAGVSEQAEAHLFEPFFTTKGASGTGLGLAISRENLARCGSSIEVGRSGLGGASFRIRMPCGEAAPKRAA